MTQTEVDQYYAGLEDHNRACAAEPTELVDLDWQCGWE